ncbi:hypothetical protein [Vibrio alginolyticus]|uniref:hypothetical protein n=1 Tax=Vibrio alginolyticus TaxID=663 RepID=UPI001B8386E8|nr:hypothetical protein [Vibrio parahaemolyticus]
MKRYLFFLSFLSAAVIAGDNITPIQGVTVQQTQISNLSIQNHSENLVQVDIYGDEFTLGANSGVLYECAGYSHLEVQVKGIVHDYFEVPCSSQVIFTELFNAQN